MRGEAVASVVVEGKKKEDMEGIGVFLIDVKLMSSFVRTTVYALRCVARNLWRPAGVRVVFCNP